MGAWRVEGGTRERPPPTKSEKMLLKSDVIFHGSIFSNNFSRNSRKIIFSIEFSSKHFKILFSKISASLWFSSKRAKIERMFFKEFWNYGKIINCLQFFGKGFLQIFESCPASPGLPPGPPTRPTPLNCSPNRRRRRQCRRQCYSIAFKSFTLSIGNNFKHFKHKICHWFFDYRFKIFLPPLESELNKENLQHTFDAKNLSPWLV